MTIDPSQREDIRRIEAAAATLRAIADCLVDGAQPPEAFGKALGVLSSELAALSQDLSRSSPPANGDGTRTTERRPAPTHPAGHIPPQPALTTCPIGRRGAARVSCCSGIAEKRSAICGTAVVAEQCGDVASAAVARPGSAG